MEYPKYCILTADTEEQAEFAKDQLHELGIKWVWINPSHFDNRFAITVMLGDERGASARWMSKFGTPFVAEAFKASKGRDPIPEYGIRTTCEAFEGQTHIQCIDCTNDATSSVWSPVRLRYEWSCPLHGGAPAPISFQGKPITKEPKS